MFDNGTYKTMIFIQKISFNNNIYINTSNNYEN